MAVAATPMPVFVTGTRFSPGATCAGLARESRSRDTLAATAARRPEARAARPFSNSTVRGGALRDRIDGDLAVIPAVCPRHGPRSTGRFVPATPGSVLRSMPEGPMAPRSTSILRAQVGRHALLRAHLFDRGPQQRSRSSVCSPVSHVTNLRTFLSEPPASRDAHRRRKDCSPSDRRTRLGPTCHLLARGLLGCTHEGSATTSIRQPSLPSTGYFAWYSMP